MMDITQQLLAIKALVFDVDGVLTNGTVWALDEDRIIRNFFTKDSFALHIAAQKGYHLAIITGGSAWGLKKKVSKSWVRRYLYLFER